MPRVVLDANVYVSALIRPQGPPGQLLRKFLRDRAFEVIVSSAILAEVRRSLHYPRVRQHIDATDEEIEAWVASLGVIADVVAAPVDVRAVVADPDDDIYVAAALDGRADLIVSGDRHLLDLGRVQDVEIVNPRAFLELLDAGRRG